MSEPREVMLRDGRRARVRSTAVDDAERVLELNRVLAVDGRGMVIGADQIRSLPEEQRRIDAIVRAAAAGDATRSLVAEVEGDPRIIASAELHQLEPVRCRHVGVLSVGVAPAFQHHGLGRALMTALIDHARDRGLLRLELYVRADNERALALYRSLGFAQEGTRARFVRADDGSFVDDRIFVRFLDSA